MREFWGLLSLQIGESGTSERVWGSKKKFACAADVVVAMLMVAVVHFGATALASDAVRPGPLRMFGPLSSKSRRHSSRLGRREVGA